MTLTQAATIAVTNQLHVRRELWPADKWFFKKGSSPYGPGWIVFYDRPEATLRERNGTQPIRSGIDFTADDILATDWTTMPAALMGCPIDPTIGSTGGAAPIPSFGSPDNAASFPPKAGVPSGGGGPTVLPPLPLPDSGADQKATVEFSGITDQDAQDPENPGYVAHLNLNRPVVFGPRGGTVHFKSGYQPNEPSDGSGDQDVIKWTATAEVSGRLWTVTLISDDFPIWGSFETSEPKEAGDTIMNKHPAGSSFISGGRAVVTVG